MSKYYTPPRIICDLTFGIFAFPSEAMAVLDTEIEDKAGYEVQEYEGWATCMKWKYGEKVK